MSVGRGEGETGAGRQQTPGRLTFTAPAVTGQVVTRRAGAAVAAGGVDAGVQAQPPSLAVMEQLALVDV